MLERFKAFFETDLGEAIIHCGCGAIAGIFGWELALAVGAWFHGREMGQHDDKVLNIFNPIAHWQVFIEGCGPLICGFVVWGLVNFA